MKGFRCGQTPSGSEPARRIQEDIGHHCLFLHRKSRAVSSGHGERHSFEEELTDLGKKKRRIPCD